MARALAIIPLIGIGCSSAAPPSSPSTPSDSRGTVAAPSAAPLPALALVSAGELAQEQGEGVPIPHPGRLLPAGLCGFDPYLSPPCEDESIPRFAVVLGEFAAGTMGKRRPRPRPDLLGDMAARPEDELRLAERALARGRELGLPAGYPFAVTYDEMPAADGRRALAVVAGLFRERDAAQTFIDSRSLGARVVELGGADDAHCLGDDYEACMKSSRTAVETISAGPAFAQKDIEAMEARLGSLPGKQQDAERERMLGAMKPACTIDRGQVAITDESELYTFNREFAPVTCAGGKRAWTDWRNTRLQSVVVQERDGAFIHQVVSVMCDSPAVDRRRFGPAPERTQVAQAVCRG